MVKIILRKAQTEDINSIYRLVCKLEEEQLDKTTFKVIFNANLARQDIHYIVAENNGKIVEFISLYIQKLLHHNGSVAEIQELFIEPTTRGKGLGTKLIQYVWKIANENNCRSFEVTCNLIRKETHKFYESKGLTNTHLKFTNKI